MRNPLNSWWPSPLALGLVLLSALSVVACCDCGADLQSPAELEPIGSTGTASRFRVALKFEMPEYGFETVGEVDVNSIFTIPDESEDFGVGFMPKALDFSDDAEPGVSIIVLDVRNPGRPGLQQQILWSQHRISRGEQVPVQTPDGESTVLVSLIRIEML